MRLTCANHSLQFITMLATYLQEHASLELVYIVDKAYTVFSID